MCRSPRSSSIAPTTTSRSCRDRGVASTQGDLNMAGRGPTAGPHGIEAVTRVLEQRGVRYEVVEHDATYSAVAEARAAAADPEATAKTVALHDRDGYRLAIVRRLSASTCVGRARSSVPASSPARHGGGVAAGFPRVRPRRATAVRDGAAPGGRRPAPRRHERIVCAGGEHRRSVLIARSTCSGSPSPRVADICEHPEDREPPGKLPSS
jgi:hypothetical protein